MAQAVDHERPNFLGLVWSFAEKEPHDVAFQQFELKQGLLMNHM